MTDQLTEEYAGTELAAEPGPPAPIRIPWAPVPKVNLLPIEIVEKRRFRRTQVLLGLAVLGVVLLAGVGTSLAGRLQMLDARSMEWTEVRVRRDPGCPVCGDAARRRTG
jgi:hypothetical protein